MEPSPWMGQLIALPIGIVLAGVLAFLWFLITPLRNGFRLLSLPEFLLLFVCLLVVHELVHAAVHPMSGRSPHSILGCWPSRGVFYAHYDGELTRSRFVAILLMPFVVISILPLAFCAVTGIVSTWIAIVSVTNVLAGCMDMLGVMLILSQIPALGILRNRGWKTYWKMTAPVEAGLCTRLDVSGKSAKASRRFSESRYRIYALGFVISAYLLLAVVGGAFYFHFKHRLPIKKPPEALAFYDAGAKQIRAGDYAGAVTNFTKAIETCSNYAEAYSFRARARYDLEDYHGAIADADKAIELNPDYEPAYNVRGSSRFMLNDYAGAIVEFDKSIKLDSNYAPAFHQRGLAYADLTNFPAAIRDFNSAIRLKPDFALAYYDRGLVEQGLTNYTAAIMDFSHAIKSHADYPNAYNMRGLAKWYLRDYDGTITDCTEAIKLNPKFCEAYNNRGLAKRDLNMCAEAIVDFDRCIDLNPRCGIAYFNRGIARHHLRNPTAAVSDFNKAIELNPQDALSYVYLGCVQSDLFQFASALKNFRKALQLNSGLVECRFRIWLIRSRTDDRVGATDELQNYLRSLKEKKMSWPAAVGWFLVGSFSEKNFLGCAKNSDPKTRGWWQCRANYYVGMKHVISGDKVGAMDFFQQSLDTKETNLTEYISAEAEFKALKKSIPP